MTIEVAYSVVLVGVCLLGNVVCLLHCLPEESEEGRFVGIINGLLGLVAILWGGTEAYQLDNTAALLAAIVGGSLVIGFLGGIALNIRKSGGRY